MKPLTPNYSQYDHRAAMTCFHLAGMLESPFVTTEGLPQSLDAPDLLPTGAVTSCTVGSSGDEWLYLTGLGVSR